MLIVYMFYHQICGFGFLLPRVANFLSFKSDTCTCFFFQSVFLHLLEAALVRTNNKCILSFASDNFRFVGTQAASNGSITKCINSSCLCNPTSFLNYKNYIKYLSIGLFTVFTTLYAHISALIVSWNKTSI